VAVGAGALQAALGTDTGGSVRLPAAFCGCVGMKTSIGLVSRSGVVPLALAFDTIGPMAGDVRTAARMLAVMQGEDPTDETTVGIRRADPLEGLERSARAAAGAAVGRRHAGGDVGCLAGILPPPSSGWSRKAPSSCR
jgi:aspartyl-tRNA(Asn)/glutamyl-tRNA(Gln) amidotransferase subunit A